MYTVYGCTPAVHGQCTLLLRPIWHNTIGRKAAYIRLYVWWTVDDWSICTLNLKLLNGKAADRFSRLLTI